MGARSCLAAGLLLGLATLTFAAPEVVETTRPAPDAAVPLIRDWRYVLTIHEIARADDDERLAKLVGDNPDRAITRLPDGRTPVHVAAEAGSLKALRVLAKAGADLDVRDGSRRTPLTIAVNADYTNTAKTLLALGADPNKEGLAEGNTLQPPLLIAARRGNLAMIKVLLASKVDVNQRGADGSVPLTIAAAAGNREAVVALLDRGADANLRDASEATALLYASIAGDEKAVAALLEHDADPRLADKAGRTPLAASESPAIWKMLVGKGADVNVVVGGASRLQHYIAEGNLELVKAWLEFKPDPFVPDRQGHTAKELARMYAHAPAPRAAAPADRAAAERLAAARRQMVKLLEDYQQRYAAEQYERENPSAAKTGKS